MEMFYLTTHSTHFLFTVIWRQTWLRTILIVRKETCCRHMGYSFRLTTRVLLYAPSYRQDNTYHSLCYTSRGALAGTRNSSMDPPHEGSGYRRSATILDVNNSGHVEQVTTVHLLISSSFSVLQIGNFNFLFIKDSKVASFNVLPFMIRTKAAIYIFVFM